MAEKPSGLLGPEGSDQRRVLRAWPASSLLAFSSWSAFHLDPRSASVSTAFRASTALAWGVGGAVAALAGTAEGAGARVAVAAGIAVGRVVGIAVTRGRLSAVAEVATAVA